MSCEACEACEALTSKLAGSNKARASELGASSSPDSVRLHFHEGSNSAYKAAVHDLDNDGAFENVLCTDVDNDGRANRTDRTRVNALVREYLKLDRQ